MMCVTHSEFLFRILQRGVSLVLLMLYFSELVLIECPSAVQRFTFSFHCGILFLSQIVNVALFVSTLSLYWFSFFTYMLTLTMYFSKLSSAAAVLTSVSLLCVAYFARLHFSSSIQSSTLIRPLPSSLVVCRF